MTYTFVRLNVAFEQSFRLEGGGRGNSHIHSRFSMNHFFYVFFHILWLLLSAWHDRHDQNRTMSLFFPFILDFSIWLPHSISFPASSYSIFSTWFHPLCNINITNDGFEQTLGLNQLTGNLLACPVHKTVSSYQLMSYSLRTMSPWPLDWTWTSTLKLCLAWIQMLSLVVEVMQMLKRVLTSVMGAALRRNGVVKYPEHVQVQLSSLYWFLLMTKIKIKEFCYQDTFYQSRVWSVYGQSVVKVWIVLWANDRKRRII